MNEMKKYFAISEEDALRRYEKYKNVDPFPDIPPALLNSAHIKAYIAKTGMVFPYFPADDSKKDRITSASLTMTIGPEVLYWDFPKSAFLQPKDKQCYSAKLKMEDEIMLRPNSITYLRPLERFNIPDYIAVRFNLRIVHVHRGLLLGTGPLLDPGYKGYPMIPVHNLTENTYTVRVGEQFINVEFTKISDVSSISIMKSLRDEYPFTYAKNSGKTFDYSFIKFIDKHVPSRKVKSSLSGVIDQARHVVQQQRKLTWGALIGALIAIAALIVGGYRLTISATETINSARDRIDQHIVQEDRIEQFQIELDKLENEIEELKNTKTDSINPTTNISTPSRNNTTNK